MGVYEVTCVTREDCLASVWPDEWPQRTRDTGRPKWLSWMIGVDEFAEKADLAGEAGGTARFRPVATLGDGTTRKGKWGQQKVVPDAAL
jgi:hypothetical protein